MQLNGGNSVGVAVSVGVSVSVGVAVGNGMTTFTVAEATSDALKGEAAAPFVRTSAVQVAVFTVVEPTNADIVTE
jgi:hypothetical protein